MPSLVLDRSSPFGTLGVPFLIRESPHETLPRAGEEKMKAVDRRQQARLSHRTPLRFRTMGVAADKTEHFTEALNISRGGFFFASSAPLQVGMPLEVTIRMPAEVTGNSSQEMRCTARVVHVRNEPYGDGRIGFGAEIEKFQTLAVQERWMS
jgi:c-di-GMP-binding flagellar brake protein YcgR